MIVVSVNSNIPRKPGAPASVGGYSWEGMQPYMREIVGSIIPFIEKNFRVKADAKHRAMCGLSMGGGQSFFIGLRRPDVFANVGIFSTGVFGGIQGSSNFDLEANIPGMLTAPDKFNSGLDCFFISCGEQDPRLAGTENFVSRLEGLGYKNLSYESFPGAQGHSRKDEGRRCEGGVPVIPRRPRVAALAQVPGGLCKHAVQITVYYEKDASCRSAPAGGAAPECPGQVV